MKIALAASAGGHLNELLKLEDVWRGHDVFFVTTGAVVAPRLADRYGAGVYVVNESNRRHVMRLLSVLADCVGILWRERPDVVISTGAAHGCLLCLLAKATGAKAVWVDSIANVERPSLSGRIIRRFADLFIVQWPELVSGYKGAEYHGELI